MATTTLVLKEPRSKTETPIFLLFRYGNNRIKISTNEKVIPKFWNKELQRIRETKQFLNYKSLNEKFDSIELAAKDIFRKYQNNNNQKKPSVEEFRELLNETLNPSPNTNENNLFGFIEKFIERAKTRVNEKTGKPFSKGIIQGYNQTLRVLQEYKQLKGKRIDFNTIDLNFYTDFTQYLTTEKRYAINNIGKHIKTLKTFLNDATERGLNTNIAYKMKKFQAYNFPAENIYLNETELNELMDLDLNNNTRLERVRDLFLVGCWTGLRFSDFSNIKPKNIKGEFIEITTKKTGEPVVIPIHSTVKRIMNKYDGKYPNSLPPALSIQKMNDYLKELGAMVESFHAPTSTNITKGGVNVIRNNKKFELITTHTARRSFASNLYLDGLPSSTIMKITGHRTERAFMKYIKITPKENAKILQLHWQRKNKLMAV